MKTRFVMIFSLFVIAALAFSFYNLAEYDSRGGETMPLFSVRRHDPYGTAALRDLLAETGKKIVLHEQPVFEDGTGRTLLQVLPYFYDTCEKKLFAPAQHSITVNLSEWIASGNTVVLLTKQYTPLMENLRVPLDNKNGMFPGLFNEVFDTARLEMERGVGPEKLSVNKKTEVTVKDTEGNVLPYKLTMHCSQKFSSEKREAGHHFFLRAKWQ